MSNNIKIFISQTYELFKRDFWILIGLNISASLLINYLFRAHEEVILLILLVLFFKNLTFIRGASIMPSVSSDFDRFSWKYYMGMPLNKKELVISLIITNLIVMCPLLVGLICFLPQLISLFADDPSKMSYSFFVKGFFLLITFFSLTSVGTVKQQIINPRRKYSKISPKILFLQNLRMFLILITVCAYGFAFLLELSEHYTFNIAPYFKWVGPFIKFIFHTWAIVPVAFLIAANAYLRLLKHWQDERFGYIKNTWVPKRDFPIVSACATAIILPFFVIDFSMPSLYEGSDLNRAVYQKNEKEIMSLIANGHDLNKPNHLGITPAFVAILEGNATLMMKLEKLGADYSGKVKGKNEHYYYDGMNALHLAVKSQKNYMVSLVLNRMKDLAYEKDARGNLPLHLAAKECRVDVLDEVLTEYKDINIKNGTGKTALHLAVGAKCFPAVDLLVSNKIDINIRDKDNKLASDYREGWSSNKNEQYLLSKKLRAPASVKK